MSTTDGKSQTPKIRFRELKYNDEGVETVTDVSDKEPPQPKQPQKPKALSELTWLRAFNEQHKYNYSKVDIKSEELRALLQIELAHDPRFHFPSGGIKDSITLTSPFEPIIHNWTRLEALANPNDETNAWKHLETRITEISPRTDKVEHTQDTSALVVLANNEKATKAQADLATLLAQVRLTPELKAYFPGLEAQRKSQSIQFDHLWTIFPPGVLVYSTVFMKKHQIFIVKESGSEITSASDSGKERDLKRVWFLVCWSYDWDGKTFNRVPVQFRFEEFQGARVINTLHCYPLQYYGAGASNEADIRSLRKELIKRGNKFRRMCIRANGAQMFEYDGEAVSHGAGFQRLKNNQNDVGALISAYVGVCLADRYLI